MKTIVKRLAFLLFMIILSSCTTQKISPSETDSSIEKPEFTFPATPSPTLTPAPSPTAIGGGSGKVIMVLSKDVFESVFPDLQGEKNIFLFSIDNNELTPLTDGSTFGDEIEFINLLDMSPDGQSILFATFSNITMSTHNVDAIGNLYVMNLDGSNLIHLSDSYFEQLSVSDLQGAFWTADGKKIIYISVLNGDNKNHVIYSVNPDGNDQKLIAKTETFPIQLIPNSETNSIYFSAGCDSVYSLCGYRKINTANLEYEWILESPNSGNNIKAVAQASNQIILEKGGNIFITDMQLSEMKEIQTTNCNPCMFFSPDGSTLLQLEVTEANGKDSKWKVQLWSFPFGTSTELSINGNDLYFRWPVWSPDSKFIMYGNNILNVETQEIETVSLPINIPDNTQILWVPDKN